MSDRFLAFDHLPFKTLNLSFGLDLYTLTNTPTIQYYWYNFQAEPAKLRSYITEQENGMGFRSVYRLTGNLFTPQSVFETTVS